MIDLDGTLIHTAPEIAAAANLMLLDLNLPVLPLKILESYIGAGVQTLLKRCLTQQLGAEPDAEIFAQSETIFFANYAENAAMSKPYDGVINGLQTLWSRSLKLACVTNKTEQFTLPLLKQAGLADFFDIVVSGDILPKNKPDPIQLYYICAKLDVPEYEAILVGDSATDIASAQAAGCFIVTVPYGYNQGLPLDISQVDATINSLMELESILI